nr:hypothetical protein [Planococcus glaciei]
MIGNIIIYRDRAHLTTRYVETMAQVIGEALEQALEQVETD